jgi:NAD(P)-dependent dehydrogenase (short-subunit alcohol dehydrogenase family)
MSFASRVAVITGAGSGLGRQLAVNLAAEGAAVGAIDLRPEPLAALEDELKGRQVAWAVGDVTDRPALRAAVAQLEQRLGPTDLLIANAGIGLETAAVGFPIDAFEAQIRVNLLGVANTVDAVLPGMLQRQRGHLVTIASLASYRGLPKMAGYCASKAGVRAFMDSLRYELRPHGIRVTTICPGWILTPLTCNLNVPHPHMMRVEVAARRILTAVRQRRAFYAFPAVAAWQVRLLGWLPCGVSDWLVGTMLRRLEGRGAAPASRENAGDLQQTAGRK